MTKLQERLYQYIQEDRFSALETDTEFILARQARNAAEEKLSVELSIEQRRLFSRYMDEENRLASIQFRHVFRETWTVIHDILSLPL